MISAEAVQRHHQRKLVARSVAGRVGDCVTNAAAAGPGVVGARERRPQRCVCQRRDRNRTGAIDLFEQGLARRTLWDPSSAPVTATAMTVDASRSPSASTWRRSQPSAAPRLVIWDSPLTYPRFMLVAQGPDGVTLMSGRGCCLAYQPLSADRRLPRRDRSDDRALVTAYTANSARVRTFPARRCRLQHRLSDGTRQQGTRSSGRTPHLASLGRNEMPYRSVRVQRSSGSRSC